MVSLKSRSIEAGLAVTRSRAAEKWLRGRGAGHVLFKICSTFDSTDAGNIGPVDGRAARRFRRCDRAGDAGLSGNRPHRLPGQSVRWLRAAERKPAEGSSAQPDARFQSGAGAGAPEPDQSRARRSRDAHARPGRGARAARRSRRPRALAPPSSMPCSTATSETIGTCGAGSSAVGRRFRNRARIARALVCSRQSQTGAVRTRSPTCRGRRAGGVPCRQLFAGDAAADRQRREGRCRCCISIPTAWSPGTEEARRALAWAGERIGRWSDSDREQRDAGGGRGPAISSWPRCQPDMPSSRRWPISPMDWCSRACADWWSPVVKLRAPWSIACKFPASSSARKSLQACRFCARSAHKNGDDAACTEIRQFRRT